MQKSRPPANPDTLALFLNLNGTRVEIAMKPDLVDIPVQLLTTLGKALERLSGALALVSGRTVTGLDKLLTPLKLPAAGIHGLKLRDATGKVQKYA